MTAEKSVSESLDTFWQYFDSGEFEQGLQTFAKFNISQEVTDFTFDPGSYYVPNMRNGSFVKPADVSDERIPILGIDDSTRRYKFVKPSVHALQRIALRNADLDIAHIERELDLRDDTIYSSGGGLRSASVYKHRMYVPDRKMIVESKPTVIVNVERIKGEYAETCPGFILHELVRVAQSLNKPCYEDDWALQKELEAYAVQNCLTNSYAIPYSLNTATAVEVNLFRKRNLGVDEFIPTEKFEADMAKDDILSKIIKS